VFISSSAHVQYHTVVGHSDMVWLRLWASRSRSHTALLAVGPTWLVPAVGAAVPSACAAGGGCQESVLRNLEDQCVSLATCRRAECLCGTADKGARAWA
jgi:hypothetical protein